MYTLPTQLEGELEWGKAIAYGGYSVVHRGTWIRPGGGAVPVAIKRIRRVYLGSEEDEDENDRFERVCQLFRIIDSGVLRYLGTSAN